MNITFKAYIRLVTLELFLFGAIFVPAGTLRFWQGWNFWILTVLVFSGITVALARTDPGLLGRRLSAGPTAESRRMQKAISTINGVAFLSMIVLSALDHRFGWSTVNNWLVWAGDAIFTLGMYAIWVVLRANRFAASTVRVEQGQQLVRVGPYAIVRHPMYTAGIFGFLGTAWALGSQWGLMGWLLLLVGIVLRTLDEEALLRAELQGYQQYCGEVRDRLIPGIW